MIAAAEVEGRELGRRLVAADDGIAEPPPPLRPAPRAGTEDEALADL